MFPHTFLGGKPIFEGKDQYNRYNKIFAELLSDNLDELETMGIQPGDLGTHSARKGVATLVAAGCTVSPPIISLCLRMGWSMGGVKERYLKHANAGDQAVGRRANLNDPLKKEYAVSCPYFDFSNIDDIFGVEKRKQEIREFLNDRLPSSANAHARNLAFRLFASVCYHHEYLEDHLNSKCPFRQSPFFCDIPEDIKKQAQIAFPWT